MELKKCNIKSNIHQTDKILKVYENEVMLSMYGNEQFHILPLGKYISHSTSEFI